MHYDCKRYVSACKAVSLLPERGDDLQPGQSGIRTVRRYKVEELLLFICTDAWTEYIQEFAISQKLGLQCAPPDTASLILPIVGYFLHCSQY